MLSDQTIVVGAFVPNMSNQLGITLRECYAICADDPFAELISALSVPAIYADVGMIPHVTAPARVGGLGSVRDPET